MKNLHFTAKHIDSEPVVYYTKNRTKNTATVLRKGYFQTGTNYKNIGEAY